MSQLPSTDQEPTAADNVDYIFTTTCAMVAGLAIVVYDQLLSISSEVDLVWIRRSSTRNWLSKTVFYAMLRLFGLLWSISHTLLNIGVPSSSEGCYRLYIVEEITIVTVTFLLQGMMSIRVWILLGMQRSVYVFLLVGFVICQIVAVINLAMYFVAYKGVTVLFDEHVVQDCFARGALPSWAPWLIPLANGLLAFYELILCACAVYYLFTGNKKRGSQGFIMGGLVATLVRDNLLYFFLAFFILLITTIENIPQIQQVKGLYWTTFATLRYVFYGLTGPWMVLDLRKQAYEDYVESRSTRMKLKLLPRSQTGTRSDSEDLSRPSA